MVGGTRRLWAVRNLWLVEHIGLVGVVRDG